MFAQTYTEEQHQPMLQPSTMNREMEECTLQDSKQAAMRANYLTQLIAMVEKHR